MRSITSFFLAFAWFFSFCSASYAETKIDPGLQYFGVYEAVIKPPHESGGKFYLKGLQRLEITKGNVEDSRHDDEYRSAASISIHLNGTNGHICRYEGTGRLDKSSDRFYFTTDPFEYNDELACKLAVVIKSNSAYTVTQSEGCQMFCGMLRNSLDGLILQKVR